jgi:hypothetical protein
MLVVVAPVAEAAAVEEALFELLALAEQAVYHLAAALVETAGLVAARLLAVGKSLPFFSP